MITRRHLLAAAGLTLVSRSAFAAAPILTVRSPGAAGPLALDLAALDAMPQTQFRTTTPWRAEATTFSGVSLADLLTSLRITGDTMRLVALNDYVVEAEVKHLVEGGALLATRQDGAVMTIENKGPIFLIFPFDDRQELKHQSYYSRSVWQLSEIDVAA